ncbi:hypothetical protein N646_0876 [Vibrio alginolyticus NBRC 15630 = ATCC 17749]|uniref:DUF3265 domain-containing protein n=1 Tax=Vibrio alginolyticus (strain ATCC 17749 / DSM 2171 / NBRC 15630 / NCIMB 1903 / NCTC 12160 / XII-53) TaxID=1219076 RepID=A0A2I3C509_VIBAX|nr:hypothetical protein N646_0876 [Vibrio alginolyticus NBRC 15630 = ATCC 17749]
MLLLCVPIVIEKPILANKLFKSDSQRVAFSLCVGFSV